MGFTQTHDQLVISTMTIQVYMNIELNLRKIFDEIEITPPISYKHVEKKNMIMKKTIVAKPNTIFFTQLESDHRGINLKNKKNNPQNHKKTKFFRNQIMLYCALEGYNINIMVFKNNFKIAGIRRPEQIYEVCSFIYNTIKAKKGDWWTFDEQLGHDKVHMCVECVMQNTGFKKFESKIDINREKLNKILNENYEEVIVSQLETTNQPSIKIQLSTNGCKLSEYEVIVFDDLPDKLFSTMIVKDNVYKKNVKQRPKPQKTTIIVFSSSEIIISGKFREKIDEAFYFINGVIDNNPHIIERKSHRAVVEKFNFDQVVDLFDKLMQQAME